ncbi:hypothetical protein PR002_g4513 [Phytophthora rubi]|uniref:Uncharacterized protein n=1 Tax=Phytophthora rubi TaxID=129364 RepID=A0A6A3N7E6_9STRA|nr:hypothetical protein PR002_g4513 [Phytophthora rubi]
MGSRSWRGSLAIRVLASSDSSSSATARTPKRSALARLDAASVAILNPPTTSLGCLCSTHYVRLTEACL